MMATYGEKLIEKLLTGLPLQKYFFYIEPNITNANSAYQNPDFVIVSPSLGVIVLEVKDWVQIKKVTQNEVVIQQRDGQIVTHTSPLKTARQYALNLSDRFKQRGELLHKRNGPVGTQVSLD